MRIGVPKEIKNHEYRVGLTPASVRELTGSGHQVLVQAGAGAAIGLDDAQYLARPAAPGADPLHLPAPRAGPGADRRAGALGRHLHRL